MGRQARLLGAGEAGSASGATLTLTPHGRVRFEGSGGGEGELDAPTVERLRDAFAHGHGHGLFHLGAVEATSALPPVFAFWRDFGRVFMTAVCAVQDLDERRDGLLLSLPHDSLRALVEAAPPMIGGEYLCLEVLEGLWAEMEACLPFGAGGLQEAFRVLRTKNPVWNQVGRCTSPSPSRSATKRLLCLPGDLHDLPGQAQQGAASALGRRSSTSPEHGTSRRCSHCSDPCTRRASAAPFLREIVDSEGSFIHWAGRPPKRIAS
jgi:hypothetical protein